jgi:hypothetical protein
MSIIYSYQREQLASLREAISLGSNSQNKSKHEPNGTLPSSWVQRRYVGQGMVNVIGRQTYSSMNVPHLSMTGLTIFSHSLFLLGPLVHRRKSKISLCLLPQSGQGVRFSGLVLVEEVEEESSRTMSGHADFM